MGEKMMNRDYKFSFFLEPDKKRLIEREIFKHLGVTSILKGYGFKSSLSILFNREPGTGKTHTIRAIVKNYLGRMFLFSISRGYLLWTS